MRQNNQDELGYEEIIWQLQNCPITYLPALLVILIDVLYSRDVLNPRGASKIVLQVESEMGMDQAG